MFARTRVQANVARARLRRVAMGTLLSTRGSRSYLSSSFVFSLALSLAVSPFLFFHPLHILRLFASFSSTSRFLAARTKNASSL